MMILSQKWMLKERRESAMESSCGIHQKFVAGYLAYSDYEHAEWLQANLPTAWCNDTYESVYSHRSLSLTLPSQPVGIISGY